MQERGSVLWKRVEVVGDIAIVGVPFNADEEELRRFAEEMMRRTGVRAVWGKKRDTSGDFRLPTYVHLAGERRSETLYREHSCVYFLDITKVFFSSKLSYEHRRIAKMVRRGEVVVNMFAGFGPFSILSFKLGQPKVVYSIDINPYAYYYMIVNIELNKTYGVIPMYGDAFRRLKELGVVDRIISPLPERGKEVYCEAMEHLRSGVYLHLFVEIKVERGEDPLERALREYPAEGGRVVRSVNPSTYHVVLDIRKGESVSPYKSVC